MVTKFDLEFLYETGTSCEEDGNVVGSIGILDYVVFGLLSIVVILWLTKLNDGHIN